MPNAETTVPPNVEGQSSASRDTPVTRTESHLAYGVLLGATAAAAGHGLFVLVALVGAGLPPTPGELGGAGITVAVAWFLAAIPISLIVLALGSALRRGTGATRALATLSVLATLAAYALYLRQMATT